MKMTLSYRYNLYKRNDDAIAAHIFSHCGMDRYTFHIIFQKTNFEILEFFVDFVLLKCYCHKRVCQHGIEIVERRGERGGRETCFKVVYFKFELSAFFLFLSLSLLYISLGEWGSLHYVCMCNRIAATIATKQVTYTISNALSSLWLSSSYQQLPFWSK